ncbi:MAG: O-antigen ligase family protein [Verrucomicrobiia bacterium]
MQTFISIGIFLVPVWVMMKRDFPSGLCGGLVLFTVMPSTLCLQAGAFEMTFQRILLLVVTLCWLPWLASRRRTMEIPFIGLLGAWWVANLLSFAFAVDHALSVKWLLSFTTEIVLFYLIVSTTLTDAESLLRAFRALCLSTAVIAILGVIEYYTQFNPALDWMGIIEPKDSTDVIVTFRHRILFGYSMAMGWPLLLALAYRMRGRLKMMAMIGIVTLAIAACYFSGSRGPWFGAAVAGAVMYVFGTSKVRKSMHLFACLTVLMVIARPGVRATIVDLTASTFDPDSYRGRSYYYRKELWPVAVSLAKTSPVRALFGHGGLSTETMDLSDRFEYGGSTYHTGFSSWDNNYACDLVEFGYVGLALEILFYGCVLLSLYRSVVRCPVEYRDIAAAFLAAAAVYALALTNVYMFSPQLKCLFLTLAILGARLPAMVAEEEQSRVEVAPDEMIDHDSILEAKPV